MFEFVEWLFLKKKTGLFFFLVKTVFLFVCGLWLFCSIISAASLIFLKSKRKNSYYSLGLCSLSLSWGTSWSLSLGCLQCCLHLHLHLLVSNPQICQGASLGSSQIFLSTHLVIGIHSALCLPWYMWQPFQAHIPSQNFSLASFFPVFWLCLLLALFLVPCLLVYVLNLLADTKKVTGCIGVGWWNKY